MGPRTAGADPAGGRTRVSPTGDGVCVDAPLRLRFEHPVEIGRRGRLRVHRGDGAVVDTIDLADPEVGRRPIGSARSEYGELHLWNYHAVLVEGEQVILTLHGALDPDEDFVVTMDPGFVRGHPGITIEDGWRFHTRTPPLPGARSLAVDAAGHRHFCTVQGAIDVVPEGNDRDVLITIAPGTYREIVYVPPTKPHLTLRGADRARTVISYPNNDLLNGDAAMRGLPIEISCCPKRVLEESDRFNCWRAVFGVDADDVTVEDVTIHNTTPYGGSQAEAFRGNGRRLRLRRVSLLSHQDTMRLQGSCYVVDSYIEGEVDVIWGTGGIVVVDTEIKALGPGYLTQIRNVDDGPGAVFVNVSLTRAPTVPDGSTYLSRVELSRFAHSQVVFVDATMDAHIATTGWITTDVGGRWDTSRLRLREHGTRTIDGRPVDLGGRSGVARLLDADEAAQFRDPATFLGGWDPR
ncbi:pectinesterase family protein [Occultella aeris]|uniref:Acyl-CoA thioesterase n=1 Tax=Occultella aeris TaxID=2761496 RepID=A0A7M4DHY4_9MICO|nr:pectinesterase family protein [Occultella aeris]VZO36531.1 acyl-CoA thioesterase [Occultella aeris]